MKIVVYQRKILLKSAGFALLQKTTRPYPILINARKTANISAGKEAFFQIDAGMSATDANRASQKMNMAR